MKLLFVDVEIAGHHAEYLCHLISYFYAQKEHSVHFLVHPDFYTQKKNFIEDCTRNTHLKIQAISKDELDAINNSNVLKKSLKNLQLIHLYASKINPERVILLHINPFILSLLLFKGKYQMSGIMFAPFLRLKKNSAKEWLKYYRKYFQTKWLVRKKNIHAIFLLNDTSGCEELNRMFKTHKFKMLTDPTPNIESTDYLDIRKEYDIDASRKIYLHFGALDTRKGTLNIVDSIPYITPKVQQQVCFFIAGQPTNNISNKLFEKIRYYKQNSQIQIIYLPEFIEQRKMKAMFEQCDMILLPYQNTESSSGILGHAAKVKKPVIGVSDGLLGELISTYKLGYLIEHNSPQKIGDAINNTYNQQISIEGYNYTDERTPEQFCKTLMDTIGS